MSITLAALQRNVAALRWLLSLLDSLRSDARLSRFIFSQNQINLAQNTVKHRAFLPPSDRKLSVFGIKRLKERTVWKIGKRIEKERQQNLHARADIARDHVLEQGLRTARDEPPWRHRNIIGWPAQDQKEDTKLIAMELAAAARLRLPPT